MNKVCGCVTCISGNSGPYKNIENYSVKYGRNAIAEYQKYSQNLCDINNENATVKFKEKYMPGQIKDGQIDKMALMGAAYEEMGKHTSIPTSLLTKLTQKSSGENTNADAIDLNKDGRIDIGEYSTTILVSDALSRGDKITPDNIKGIVTNEGLNKSLVFANKKNFDMAYKTYSALYDYYNLGCAQYNFISDKNNL